MIEWIRKWVHHAVFSHIVMGLIVINAVLVGLETYPSFYEPYRDWFYFADQMLLWIFTLEILLRIVVEKKCYHFFRDKWNVFDFILIISGHLIVGAHFLTVFRVLRVLRVLRAVSLIPSLRRLVEALLLTIPSMGNIVILLGIVFYIFAVMGTVFFRDVSPEFFGSIHLAMLTLFQVVTLDSWATVVMYPIMEELPWAWVYFVAFILVGTFIVLNLFVGVIVNKVEKADEALERKEEDQQKTNLELEIRELKAEIQQLNRLIRENKR